MGAVIEIHADPVPLETWDDGSIRVKGTRLQLEVLIDLHRQGQTAEQLAEAFHSLSLADAHAVIAYALRHAEEVDAYLADRAELAREAYERAYPSSAELRERLQARRASLD